MENRPTTNRGHSSEITPVSTAPMHVPTSWFPADFALYEYKTRCDKTRQDKPSQDKTTQGKTRQAKTRQGKTRQGKTRQDKARQDKRLGRRQSGSQAVSQSGRQAGSPGILYITSFHTRTGVQVTLVSAWPANEHTLLVIRTHPGGSRAKSLPLSVPKLAEWG